MQFGGATRRSIRYSIFVGVLAGSVFAGSGAFADPIPITTQAELEAIGASGGARAGDYYLNFSGAELALTSTANSSYIAGTFTGTFDGNGKTLSGLTKPLFDVIGTNTEDAEISNLTLTTASGTGVQGRGVLANDSFNSSFDEISASGKVTSSSSADVGGLIGIVINGVINQSTANVNVVTSAENSGGIVGRIDATEIQNSMAWGNVTGGSNVGGLVGKSNNSLIESSISSGSVSGVEATVSNSTVFYCVSATCNWINIPTFTTQQNIGGLVGESSASTIMNSSSSGAITGNKNIGGLIGFSSNDDLISTSSSSSVNGQTVRTRQLKGFDPTSGNDFLYYESLTSEKIGGLVGNSTSEIQTSHSTGYVTASDGTYVGGLVGISSGSITQSFSTSAVNGISNIGGLVGNMNGIITNSYASGALQQGSYATQGNRVGGLVGVLAGGEITGSHASAGGVSITGADRIGGLVGQVDAGLVSNSYANIAGEIKGFYGGYVGGLIGQSQGSVDTSHAVVQGKISAVGNYVGGLVAHINSPISNSYANTIGGVAGIAYIGGLVGFTSGNISESNATGDVTGEATNSDGFSPISTLYLGGLVGLSEGNISTSYATGRVKGIAKLDAPSEYLGGLAGKTTGVISNSYATGNVIGEYLEAGGYAWSWRSGGLIGESHGTISNSYATGNVVGSTWIGGLVGNNFGTIRNSYSTGDVTDIQFGGYVGGLVGINDGDGVLNSFATGNVNGISYVGGLVGLNFSSIENSYASGSATGLTLVGNLMGFNEGADPVNSFALGDDGFESFIKFPAILDIVNAHIEEDDSGAFSANDCFNEGYPYLISLSDSYSDCGEGGDSGSEEEDSTPDRPIRERVEREVREVAESRTLEKIEKSVGFKNETLLPKSAPISFVESTEKIDLAKVKAVEIAPTANVKVVAKAGEALQISLKSESKEPVELWVRSPDGSWLLAGVITFDKDGKAILPPLQFKSAGDYTLVLNKPSMDSAKGSAPLNQSGSVLVAVS